MAGLFIQCECKDDTNQIYNTKGCDFLMIWYATDAIIMEQQWGPWVVPPTSNKRAHQWLNT